MTSISSACLIVILMRNELIDGSIRHFSRALRHIRIGFIVDILDDLVDNNPPNFTDTPPQACCGVQQTLMGSFVALKRHEESCECSLDTV